MKDMMKRRIDDKDEKQLLARLFAQRKVPKITLDWFKASLMG